MKLAKNFKHELFIILLHILCCVHRANQSLTLGGLFEEKYGNEEMAFHVAIEMNNMYINNRPSSTNLDSIAYTASHFDTMKVAKQACSLIQNGIVGLIAPQSYFTSDYIKSLCDIKDIPLLQTHWDTYHKPNGYMVNLYPYPAVLAQAYVSIIQSLGWKGFTILYDNDKNLYHVMELLRMYSFPHNTISLRQLNPDEDYRRTWLEIKRSGERYFALDCSTKILNNVLQQAQHVGIISENYNFLIMNLDLYTIDLYPYQFGGANIIGVRLIDTDNPNVTIASKKMRELKISLGLIDPSADLPAVEKLNTGTALVIDAIFLLNEALRELKITKRNVRPMFCNTTAGWEKGSTIINYMKANTLSGLTGPIVFDVETGSRKNFNLDVVEVSVNGLNKVGTWNTQSGLHIMKKVEPDDLYVDEDNIMRNRMFKVISTLTPPYGMLKNVSGTLQGNDRYEGYGIELIEALSKKLGFRYTIIIQENGANGNYNKKKKHWNGMLGEVIAGRADFAISDLTISYERERDVDFTMPFMTLGISILYKKPEPAPPSLFTFASPFSGEVWLLLGVSYLLVSMCFFIIGRLSPSEWTNPYSCIEEPEFLVNQYTFRNALWFTVGSLMQQGSEIAPIGISTRMASGVWWFFTLVMVSSYTANLAAFLTVEELVTPFNDVQELVEHKEISYGAKLNGATYFFFRDSNYSVYPIIRDYMNTHPDEMMIDNDSGVEKAEQENYAFFMESTSIEYVTERHCELKQVGGALDEKGYGIAMQKNSKYRYPLSMAILQLQETGTLEKIKRKWWKEKRGGGTCEKRQPAATPLDLKNLGGVFFVLGVGTILSILGTLVELVIYTYKKSKKHKTPFKKRVKSEIKFFFNFKQTVKDVDQSDTSIKLVETSKKY